MKSFPARSPETASSTAPRSTHKHVWEGIKMFHAAEQDQDKLRMHYAIEHLSFLMDMQRLSAAPLCVDRDSVEHADTVGERGKRL